MKQSFVSGHTACGGCGQAMAAKLIINAIGSNAIVANATGCLEVFSAGYPHSSWGVPFIHSLFENAAAVASGIESAMKHLGREDITVISEAGDGGTGDIGLQALSGMWERGQNILSICYDNEAYMNTGIQRSGLTPLNANTTTSPSGKESTGNWRPKKNLPEIAVAHNCVYVATASVGYPADLQRKVKKAVSMRGPKYLHVFVPCPLGWRHDQSLTYEISRAAVQTGLVPLMEYENGVRTSVFSLTEARPVEDYLKPQGRFAHLFKDTPVAKAELERVRKIANHNVEKYGLLKKTSRPVSQPASQPVSQPASQPAEDKTS
ncbi:MAG: pyruvate ferredoxin oxidoreductase [Elusimicrobia bacterium]|nr:pyruvate ferredoxin oxidoreductase [Elusimicrobiota bacterium]